MIQRVFSIVYNRTSGINEAAFLLGMFTFLSQILGLIRDRLLATYIGAGPELDAYYAAFKIPDLLYVSIATLASITVLLPVLTKKYGDGDTAGKQAFAGYVNQVFSFLLGFLVVISVILWIFFPEIVPWFTPGMSPESRDTVVSLGRIMLAQPILIGISNMLSSVTQFFKKFLITALAPVVYNIGIIIGITVFYGMFGPKGLAMGVILGAAFHLLIQLPVMVMNRVVPRPTLNVRWSEIRELITISIPRTLGLSLNAVTLIVLTALASTLGVGSIALFSLTNNMLNVPIAIIGISYSVASFPILVKYINDHRRPEFIQQIIHGTQKIIFWSTPVVILFIVLRAQIVRVVLGAHSFSWDNTRIAAALLALFVVGLVAQSLIHLYVRGMYAMGNTKGPLITNGVSQVIIVGLALLFVKWFTYPEIVSGVQYILRLDGIADIRLLALPLAFAVGNIVNCLLLIALFKKKFPETNFSPVRTTLGQILLASLVMGGISYSMLQLGAQIVNQDRFWGIFAQGLIAGVTGIISFVLLLIIMRNRDIMEFWGIIHRKFWKSKVVVDTSTV